MNQTTETIETNPRKAKRRQAAEALNAALTLINGPRGAKKAAKQEAKIQRRADRKATLLAMLTAPTEPLRIRTALMKTVVALKAGATVEELLACVALQLLTEWSKLAEPIAVFAAAKSVDPSTLLAGLGCTVAATTPTQSSIKASSGSMDAPVAPETTKPPSGLQTTPKAAQGRHQKGRP